MDRNDIKLRWRAAADMHERLARRRRGSPRALPEEAWRECRAQLEKFTRLQQVGRQASLQRLEPEIVYQLRYLAAQLEPLAQQVTAACLPRPIAAPADIVRDLAALEAEFEGLEIDVQQCRLTVTTEGIELDEAENVGAFEIVLDWKTFDRPGVAYRVRSLDAPDVIVPHPHDEVLCEGEAAGPIAEALRQGRLFDFLVVVRQVLRNYNRTSAFDGFADDDSVPCVDCGYRATEDAQCWCSLCERDVCDECAGTCESCGEIRCHGCCDGCASCGDTTCKHCQKVCATCEELFCERCLIDEKCQFCRAEAASQTEPSPAAAAAEPAVLPVCLGQAAVSA